MNPIDYRKFFEDHSNSFQETLKCKLKDSNKMKSSISDPHKRTVAIAEVHQFTYKTFISKFFDTQKQEDTSNTEPFFMNCLNELSNVFSNSNMVKFHGSGDISLITPWSVVLELKEISQGQKRFTLEAGALLLPVSKDNEYFVPCGGLDENDNVPNWCSEIDIRKLLPGLKPEDVYPLKQPGNGVMSGFKGMSFTSIRSGQVEIGDFLVCRGQYMQVLAFGDDAFYRPGEHDSIRFVNDLKRNINNQRFEIVRYPKLVGQIIKIENDGTDLVKIEEPVAVCFKKPDKNRVGTVNISYRNACFNKLGFLTHDTHIFLD